MKTMVTLQCGTCGNSFERTLKEYNSSLKKNPQLIPSCSIKCARTFNVKDVPTQTVIERYKEGSSSIEIANLYSVSDGFIRKLLKRNGVSLRTKSENGVLKNPMQGKTHSDDTKRVLSELAKKQFKSTEARQLASHTQIEYMKNNPNRQQRSKLEFVVEKELDKLGIQYKSPYPVQDLKTGRFKALADIYLIDFGTIIEVNGTYWHSDPRVYTKGAITESQKHVEKKYKAKLSFYKERGFKIIELWEQDIKKCSESAVKSELIKGGIING